jgi:hypothetical protein
MWKQNCSTHYLVVKDIIVNKHQWWRQYFFQMVVQIWKGRIEQAPLKYRFSTRMTYRWYSRKKNCKTWRNFPNHFTKCWMWKQNCSTPNIDK